MSCPRIRLTGLNQTLVLAAALLTTIAASTNAAESSQVQQTDFINYDKTTRFFTASVDNMAFDWVLQQLEESAGIEFTVFEDDYAPVSAQFENLPLETAIKLLLAGSSYMISSGDMVRIFVLSREDGNTAGEYPVPDDGKDDPFVDSAYTPLPEATPVSADDLGQAASHGVDRDLLESLGATPELDELLSKLEQMPEMDLSEEDIMLLQGLSDGQVSDALLNDLLKAGASGSASPDIDHALPADELNQ